MVMTGLTLTMSDTRTSAGAPPPVLYHNSGVARGASSSSPNRAGKQPIASPLRLPATHRDASCYACACRHAVFLWR